MSKTFSPKIVSANDLMQGDVVYLHATGGWTRDLREAAVAVDEDRATELLTFADQPSLVVGPYLVDVSIDADGRLTPLHFRERFRESGPSTRTDLGRQAGRLGLTIAHPVLEEA